MTSLICSAYSPRIQAEAALAESSKARSIISTVSPTDFDLTLVANEERD